MGSLGARADWRRRRPIDTLLLMELSVTLREPHKRAALFGVNDANLRQIRDALGVRLQARSPNIKILGEPAAVARAAALLERLQDLLRDSDQLPNDAIESLLDESAHQDQPRDESTLRVFSRDAVAAKTEGQRDYIRAMMSHDLTVCIGPAGTGKTYLAVAVAVHLLRAGTARRVILVRPAVEAGERLGFLPGDIQQKVNPYLRPLLDAMHDMLTYDQLKRFMVNDIVEMMPLAYMRGRTFNHSVIIMDEAQNTTPAQMLMFLTRLGHHSKMIVTGDDSQVDLEPGQPSGLIDAVRRLSNLSGVAVKRLRETDIVRHRLVSDIIGRYGDQLRRPADRPTSKAISADNVAREPDAE